MSDNKSLMNENYDDDDALPSNKQKNKTEKNLNVVDNNKK